MALVIQLTIELHMLEFGLFRRGHARTVNLKLKTSTGLLKTLTCQPLNVVWMTLHDTLHYSVCIRVLKGCSHA